VKKPKNDARKILGTVETTDVEGGGGGGTGAPQFACVLERKHLPWEEKNVNVVMRSTKYARKNTGTKKAYAPEKGKNLGGKRGEFGKKEKESPIRSIRHLVRSKAK